MSNFSEEKNVLMLMSLMKAHNIKKVIVSPGTTNISLIASMQQDAVAGFIRKELYVAAKYGVSEEEALKMMPQQDERFQIAEE